MNEATDKFRRDGMRVTCLNNSPKGFEEIVNDDLLVTIFNLRPCLQHKDQRLFAIAVSHVSKRWRVIALNTPLLWANITISETCLKSELDVFLERSKEVPLTASIIMDRPIDHLDEIPRTLTFGAKLQMLCMHSRRWQIIVIKANDNNYIRYVLNAIRDAPHLPLLRSLELSSRTFRHPGVERELFHHQPTIPFGFIFQGGAPLLSVVNMQRVNFFENQPPLKAIKTLSIGAYTHAPEYLHLRETMMRMRQLTELHISCVHSQILFTGSVTTNIALPALRRLTLHKIMGGDSHLKIFFKVLVSPQLSELNLIGMDTASQDGFSACFVQDPPATRFPKLGKLHIEMCDTVHVFIHRIIHAFSTISILSVRHVDAGPLLQILGAGFPGFCEARMVLPRLNTLIIRNPLGSPSGDDLCRLVMHRHNIRRPLQRLVLCSYIRWMSRSRHQSLKIWCPLLEECHWMQ